MAGSAVRRDWPPLAPRPLFEPVLMRLEADGEALFSTAHLRLVPVQYEERPFSHLLRVGVCRDGAETPDLHLFVKLFKPKADDGGVEKMRARVAHDFQVSRRIFEAMGAAEAAGAVRPVACYVDHLAIVSEQTQGETLMAFLDARVRWFPSPGAMRAAAGALAAVGRWLRVFQSIEPGPGLVRLTDLRAYVDVRLQRLVAHGVLTAGFRERLLSHLEVLAAHVPESELIDVLIHADLAPGNVLIADGRVVVLDFAMVQRGCALHDLARLYVQLDVLRAKPQFRAAVVRALQAALLGGFDETLTAGRPLFRYFVMLHRINHLGSLALGRENLLASAFSRRVRRLHRAWIDAECEAAVHGVQR